MKRMIQTLTKGMRRVVVAWHAGGCDGRHNCRFGTDGCDESCRRECCPAASEPRDPEDCDDPAASWGGDSHL